MAATFISYRRDDAAGYAGRLRESLERRLGPDGIFRDVDALKPGQDFVDAIETRLAACQVMLVVIGREWLDARQPDGARRLDDPLDFVRLEVAAGLARRQVLVVPVLVEGATMPVSQALPENIRALARRHALSLRDETWDEDVGRLVSVIQEAIVSRTPATTQPRTAASAAESSSAPGMPGTVRPWMWGAAGVLLALLALAAIAWYVGRETPGDRPATVADAAPAPAVAAAAGRRLDPHTIDIPRVAEVAFGRLVYTLVSGNVTPRGEANELRLRMRLMNYGPVDTNFWNQTFRLAVAGDTLQPSGDLNDLVPGRSLRYGIVSFRVPRDARTVVLQLINGNETAEIPLDVTPTGRAPVDEQAEVPDSLSQAIARRVPGDAIPLLTTDAIAVTLVRAATRRFANVLRLSLDVRVENRGRAPVHSGLVLFRVAAGSALVAPLESTNEAIEPASTISPTIVFDLPVSTTQAVVRTISGDHSGSRTFDLR
jgi:hypothetical protein